MYVCSLLCVCKYKGERERESKRGNAANAHRDAENAGRTTVDLVMCIAVVVWCNDATNADSFAVPWCWHRSESDSY